jgi:hypothetical protein
MALSGFRPVRRSGNVADRNGDDPVGIPAPDIATMQQQIYLNTSTVANGIEDGARFLIQIKESAPDQSKLTIFDGYCPS